MNFFNVMRWLLDSTEEERLALSELLAFMKARTQPRPPPVPESGRFPGSLVEARALGEQIISSARAFKPGRYKLRVTKTMAPFQPKSPFSKAWWARFLRASVPMTPLQLATAAGKPERHNEVSASLGNLRLGEAAMNYTLTTPCSKLGEATRREIRPK